MEIGDDPIFLFLRKRLTGVESPGAFVVAPHALMHAASDKQRAAGAGAVDDINGIILVVIHTVEPML
ncbi:hypothetical protein SOASR014_06600 [Pectobacterium carotovorum subsp. carotovorum]|nr:hypothetical protein SOASR014_06600 [Pectobacterium carotovorum subsp. carotovorum]GLX43981.1 hypothetical protein Pcaca01_16490 [Pectobacterium carotovorum subsp. carotovorum]